MKATTINFIKKTIKIIVICFRMHTQLNNKYLFFFTTSYWKFISFLCRSLFICSFYDLKETFSLFSYLCSLFSSLFNCSFYILCMHPYTSSIHIHQASTYIKHPYTYIKHPYTSTIHIHQPSIYIKHPYTSSNHTSSIHIYKLHFLLLRA